MLRLAQWAPSYTCSISMIRPDVVKRSFGGAPGYFCPIFFWPSFPIPSQLLFQYGVCLDDHGMGAFYCLGNSWSHPRHPSSLRHDAVVKLCSWKRVLLCFHSTIKWCQSEIFSQKNLRWKVERIKDRNALHLHSYSTCVIYNFSQWSISFHFSGEKESYKKESNTWSLMSRSHYRRALQHLHLQKQHRTDKKEQF